MAAHRQTGELLTKLPRTKPRVRRNPNGAHRNIEKQPPEKVGPAYRPHSEALSRPLLSFDRERPGREVITAPRISSTLPGSPLPLQPAGFCVLPRAAAAVHKVAIDLPMLALPRAQQNKKCRIAARIATFSRSGEASDQLKVCTRTRSRPGWIFLPVASSLHLLPELPPLRAPPGRNLFAPAGALHGRKVRMLMRSQSLSISSTVSVVSANSDVRGSCTACHNLKTLMMLASSAELKYTGIGLADSFFFTAPPPRSEFSARRDAPARDAR
jgi:hypothetical protein